MTQISKNARINQAQKNITTMTNSYWRTVDAIKKIVDMHGGSTINMLPNHLSAREYKKLYLASQVYSEADRKLGLSFNYYRIAVELENPSAVINHAAECGMTMDDFRAYIRKEIKPKSPTALINDEYTHVTDLVFNNFDKRFKVTIVAKDDVPYIKIGGKLLTKKDVYSIHRAMCETSKKNVKVGFMVLPVKKKAIK
jgi:hypothetical protein